MIKGVVIETLSEKLRQEYGIAEDTEGVLVTSVDKDSAAASVLEEGDVITQINHKPVKDKADVLASKENDKAALPLKIIRNGRTKYVVIHQ